MGPAVSTKKLGHLAEVSLIVRGIRTCFALLQTKLEALQPCAHHVILALTTLRTRMQTVELSIVDKTRTLLTGFADVLLFRFGALFALCVVELTHLLEVVQEHRAIRAGKNAK